MKKNHLNLIEADKAYLEQLLKNGKLPAQRFKRVIALLALDEGLSYRSVSKLVKVGHHTVSIWCQKYKESGLSVLVDQAGRGRKPKIDGDQRAKITALACSAPPEGHVRWSLRLLADRVVELGYCEHLSHTHVGKILKKTH